MRFGESQSDYDDAVSKFRDMRNQLTHAILDQMNTTPDAVLKGDGWESGTGKGTWGGSTWYWTRPDGRVLEIETPAPDLLSGARQAKGDEKENFDNYMADVREATSRANP